MAILTSSSTSVIGAGALLTETTTVTVLAAAAPGTGTGRLVHPTLGTFDYSFAPDEWTNLLDDIVIPPVWANARTLDGAANTLWPGSIQDVIVTERWISPISMPLDFLRQLITFWQNPSEPPAFLEWRPSYANDLGYRVIMLSVTSGGREITLDFITRQSRQYVRGVVEVQYRLIGYAI